MRENKICNMNFAFSSFLPQQHYIHQAQILQAPQRQKQIMKKGETEMWEKRKNFWYNPKV